MEEMMKALDFQNFKLKDNTLPKDLAQDQVLSLDYVNKSVECLPAKRALEAPDKAIMSVQKYMRESTCYRLKEGSIAIYGDYDLSREEELYPGQNPYETSVIARLEKDDYIELYPDGRCYGYPLHEEEYKLELNQMNLYIDHRVADKKVVKDLLAKDQLIVVDETEIKKAVNLKLEKDEAERERIEPVLLKINGNDIHQVQEEFNNKIKSYLNDNKKEGDLYICIDVNNKSVIECNFYKDEVKELNENSLQEGVSLFQKILERQGCELQKNNILDKKYVYVDNAGNKWEASSFSKEEAIKASLTLDNCHNCINCRDCKNSIDCENCKGCVNCVGMVHCEDCKDSLFCSNSKKLTNCKVCNECIDSQDLRQCDNCQGCKNCEICRECYGCINKKNISGECVEENKGIKERKKAAKAKLKAQTVQKSKPNKDIKR